MTAFGRQLCDCRFCPYWAALGAAARNLELNDALFVSGGGWYDERVVDDFFGVAAQWRVARAAYLRHVESWAGEDVLRLAA